MDDDDRAKQIEALYALAGRQYDAYLALQSAAALALPKQEPQQQNLTLEAPLGLAWHKVG